MLSVLSPAELTRRRLLRAGVALAASPALLAACGDDGEPLEGSGDAEQPVALEPTPACADGDEPTPAQTEGPFFLPESPERTSIGNGAPGEPLLLTGAVLGTDCRPVPGALLDFWQADGEGVYDLEGYRLRGNQRADAKGRYRLETVLPGEYPGRTPHIHVMAQREGGEVLTTQLYFPGQPANDADALFDERLLVSERGGGEARFDFVLG